MQSKHSTHVDLLSLPEIAAWQLVHPPALPNAKYIADLPAIQRGSVWKIKQVEELWDSIVQGFPIGAFLLAPIESPKDLVDRGIQDAKYQEAGRLPATHHLLDGQQRATAITLGFLDPWQSEKCKGALWIDLAHPPKGRDIAYVFRALTVSHPWGYKRSDPAAILSVGQIRDALKAFIKANQSLTEEEQRPGQIPLKAAWPYDAEAPIPLFLLISAVLEERPIEESKEILFTRLKALPFWQKTEIDWHEEQKKKLEDAFTKNTASLAIRLQNLMTWLKRLINGGENYRVPILVLPQILRSENMGEPDNKQDEEPTPDPIETLFVRINSGGTPLEGEELIYSLIKSHWVEAPKFIEKLQHKLAVPSRIALLCARLVLAKTERARSNIPATPGVSEFRRLMRGIYNKDQPKFIENFKDFVQGKGGQTFEIAYSLLTDGNYALPPVLAMEVAQRAPDVFFLLLRWIVRMLEEGHDPLAIDRKKRSHLIGFITSLAWFAHDKGKSVAALWSDLQTINASNLNNFFNNSHFSKTFALTERNGLRMIPLPSPEMLKSVLTLRVTSGARDYPGIGRSDSDIWKSWDRWARLNESLPAILKDWYKERISEQWLTGREDWEEGLVGIYSQAWQSFVNNLWSNRSVILYAQRNWLNKWFPDFDPSQPENLEDKNRPWDYDHLHPQKYLTNERGNSRRSIPAIIWDWHNSIGNLRAYPLELNRADSDTSPVIKLEHVSNEEKFYGITDSELEKAASFVGADDWPLWQASTPQEKNDWYLANPDYHSYRKALIEAIITRFIALYRNWYEILCIAELMS